MISIAQTWFGRVITVPRQQIRIDLVARFRAWSCGTAIERLYPHPLNQRRDMPAADLASARAHADSHIQHMQKALTVFSYVVADITGAMGLRIIRLLGSRGTIRAPCKAITQIDGLGPYLSLKLIAECRDLCAWPSAKHFASCLILRAKTRDRPRRPLSRGFGPASYPVESLVSFQIDRHCLDGIFLRRWIQRAAKQSC